MDDSSTSSAELVAQANETQIVLYVIVASMTLLIYDYCLTLADEVHLIWISKLNVINILYFLSRYPAFADVSLTIYVAITPNIPIHQCVPVNDALSWLTVIGISVAELILVLRTFALWAGSKKVLYGLLSLFTAFFIASLIISGLYLRTAAAIPLQYPYIGCSFTGGSPIIFVNIILLIVFETVIMGMTIFRGYRKFRGTTNPLISTLYRDGTMFYVCLFAISLANVFVLSLGPPEFLDLITTFQRVMHSILSCRIIIHARQTDNKLHAAPHAAIQLGKLPESAVFTTVIMDPDVSTDLSGNGLERLTRGGGNG